MGRNPKSNEMKVIQGTFRKDRDHSGSPIPSEKPATCPDWLTDSQKKFFWLLCARLNDVGLNSETYDLLMALTAIQTSEVADSCRAIKENGRTFQVKNTVGDVIRKPSPEVSMLNTAVKHLQSLLREFGLSPASRSSIKIAFEGATDKEPNPYENFTK